MQTQPQDFCSLATHSHLFTTFSSYTNVFPKTTVKSFVEDLNAQRGRKKKWGKGVCVHR